MLLERSIPPNQFFNNPWNQQLRSMGVMYYNSSFRTYLFNGYNLNFQDVTIVVELWSDAFF